jgi:DNA-directed RNA polymerase beta' subunit
MTLQVLPEFCNDKVRVQEIANYIEQLPLSGFMKEWQIFFERYGAPVHPTYAHEATLISDFNKLHTQIKPPSDLTNWCIRLVLDKSKLIEKAMRIDTIYRTIRSRYPGTYVVYSANNAESAIMRIYLSNTFSKKAINYDIVHDFMTELRGIVVRGVPGVKAAYVKEGKRSILTPEGVVSTESYYYLFTDGSNIERILENPYIDPNTVQPDSIQEMLELFGIGAACLKIRSELKQQIPELSNKHYAVYADEMTSTGTISQISRHGSATRKSSALQRISDASPINVIEETASIATSDKLTGISPAIMMGKSPRAGDLYNTFMINEDFVKENVQSLSSVIDAL